MNRSIHRWASLPIAIIMLLVALTGIWLQVYEFGDDEGRGERGGAPAQAAAMPSPEEIGPMVTSALVAGRAAKPDFTPVSVTVTLAGGQPKVALNGPGFRQAARIDYDPATGDATYTPPPPASIHGLIIGLHTGKVGGILGLILVMASGIVLVVLSVTGLLVYIDMWKRRNKAGKTGLFW